MYFFTASTTNEVIIPTNNYKRNTIIFSIEDLVFEKLSPKLMQIDRDRHFNSVPMLFPRIELRPECR